MAGNIEYGWSLGQFQYVHWMGTQAEWTQVTERDLIEMGQQWKIANDLLIYGKNNPAALPEDQAQELIEKELGGKVIEVTENKPEPESKAWTVKIDTTPKEWEPPAAAPAKPATKGFEDF